MVHRLSIAISVLVVALATNAFAQPEAQLLATSKPEQELNLNLFRNPSIGLEYRRGPFAVHGGLYPTIISNDEMGNHQTSWFTRLGVTHFLIPMRWYGQRPSEFYVSASYLRGLNFAHGNAALLDVGYRWMVWHGLNVRIGVAVLLERNHDVKVNPTPGIGWSTSW